jgi:hypothetical protein
MVLMPYPLAAPLTRQGDGQDTAQIIGHGKVRQLQRGSHGARLEPTAMQTCTATAMLLSRVAPVDAGVSAAIIVAGTLTTTPAAAARPTLLCIGSPDKLITVLVKMPRSSSSAQTAR